MFTRSLLYDPGVLFLDVPSRSLDPIATGEVRETINNIRKNGQSILLTHYLPKKVGLSIECVEFIMNGHIISFVHKQNLYESIRVTILEQSHFTAARILYTCYMSRAVMNIL
jgi:ABC-type multidrug transport system ATPase subunit